MAVAGSAAREGKPGPAAHPGLPGDAGAVCARQAVALLCAVQPGSHPVAGGERAAVWHQMGQSLEAGSRRSRLGRLHDGLARLDLFSVPHEGAGQRALAVGIAHPGHAGREHVPLREPAALPPNARPVHSQPLGCARLAGRCPGQTDGRGALAARRIGRDGRIGQRCWGCFSSHGNWPPEAANESAAHSCRRPEAGGQGPDGDPVAAGHATGHGLCLRQRHAWRRPASHLDSGD